MEGVVINGVRWAECNVGIPGTFAACPEDFGCFFRWGRKMVARTMDELDEDELDEFPYDDYWRILCDPSPAGWRIPDKSDIDSLLHEKVFRAWKGQNGVSGMEFIDKCNGNSIFLPAAGRMRYSDGMICDTGNYGNYWSCSAIRQSRRSWDLGFFSIGADLFKHDQRFGFSVRCCNYKL
jgi:uncharacterized protein (TIGR02145 family)